MNKLSRRSYFKGAAAAAAVGAATPSLVGLIEAEPAAATQYTGTVEGPVHDQGGQVFDVKSGAYGALGNTVIGQGGAINQNGNTFTAGNGTFASGDVGKVITIQGAGASGGVLSTTIVTVVTSAVVTLAADAKTTVTDAAFAYGTDDTVAIASAIAAAAPVGGTVLAPPGIYMILGSSNGGGPLEFSGSVGMSGCGSSSPGSTDGTSTTFICGDAAAGLLANGCGTFEKFRCDGNLIATAPFQNGTIVNGEAMPVSANAKFISLWLINSAGAGLTIYGAQNNAYYDIHALNNVLYGVYIDGGAGGLDFVHWEEASPNHYATYKYGLQADAQVPGGTGTYGDHTENIQFSSGIIDGGGGGTSRVYLRRATNWRFYSMLIVGNNANLTGPCIDLDQSYGFGIDFSRSYIWARKTSGMTAGQSCIQVSGQPSSGSELKTFLLTDSVFFVTGDNSIYLEGYGNYYSAVGWLYDETLNGPVAASGLPGIDTMLRGRQGNWQSATAISPWNGTLYYRVDAAGLVRLKGSASSAGGGGSIIAPLPLGYRPATDIQLPASATDGAGVVTITTDGTVSGSSIPAGQSLYLDGITFVPDYPLPQ